MKFVFAPRFEREARRLPADHRRKLASTLPRFSEAADQAAAGADDPWPRGLRIKRLVGTPDIWEMTWSMNDPDGRVTWQWTVVGGQPAILLRRVGNHSVLKRP